MEKYAKKKPKFRFQLLHVIDQEAEMESERCEKSRFDGLCMTNAKKYTLAMNADGDDNKYGADESFGMPNWA